MVNLSNVNYTFISNGVAYTYDTSGNEPTLKNITSISVANDAYDFNVAINSTSLSISNSTANITITSPTPSQIASGNYYLNANGSWSLASGGSSSVNTATQYTWTNTQTFTNTITFSSVINGTSNNSNYLNGNSASDLIAYSSNAYSNSISYINSKSFVNTSQLSSNLSNYQTTIGLASNVATLTANNTSFVGSVTAANVVSNSQLQSNLSNYQTTIGLAANVATLTANNTSYVGSISSSNVVSNSQLQSNLANYVNTSQLSSNLSNYQTTTGLSANVATLTANNTSFVGSISSSNVVSNSQLQSNLANYVNTSQLSSNLSNYQTTIGFASNVATLTANNTSYVGSVTAANVVSNSQLQSNLANYVNTSQLSSNLNNYQTTVGLSANVAKLAANSALFANSSVYANQSITNTFTIGTSTYFVSNGNVGIGTSSPAYKLDVNGAARIPGLLFSSTGGDQYLYDSGSGSAGIRAGTGGTDVYYAFYGNGQFASLNGGGYFNGNVGIGTSSPGALLDVYNSTNQTGYSQLALFRQVNSGSNYSRTLFGQISNNAMFVEVADQSNNKGTLYLQPYGGNVSMGSSSAFYLSNSGYVGIGTTSPTYELQVQTSSNTVQIYGTDGTIGITPSYTYNGVGYTGTLTNHPYGFITNNSEKMRIDSSGKVGIGTSSPAYKLDVNGGAISAGNGLRLLGAGINVGGFTWTQLNNAFGLGNTAASAFAWNYTNGVGELNLFINRGAGAGGGFYIYDFPNTNGTPTNIFTVTGNGSVGINTNSPAYQLDVVNSSGAGSGRIYGASGGANFYITAANSNANMWLTSYGGSGHQYAIYASTDGSLGFYDSTATSERMRINSSGYVGIGTSSPSALLDVNGTIRSGGGGTDPGTGVALYFVGSGSYQTVVAGAAFAINTGLNNARTERLRVDINGNVGIGTSSPAYPLDVNGDVRLGTNLYFNSANPYIYSGGSYITIPNGLYVSGGYSYFQNQAQFRAGIYNDNATYLEINGGTSGFTNFNTTGQSAYVAIYGSSTSYPALSVGDSTGIDNGATYGMVNLTRAADTTKAHLALIRAGNYVWQMGYINGTNTLGLFPFNFSGTQGTSTMSWAGSSVGINTNSPLSATGYGWLTINGSTGDVITQAINNTEYFRIQSYGSASFLGTLVSTPLLFYTNNSEKMRIDTNGRVGINSTGNGFHRLVIEEDTNTTASILCQSISNTASPGITFGRLRASSAAVQNGDTIGQIQFSGYDGSTGSGTTYIAASVDGGTGTGNVPTNLTFATTPSGSLAPSERMRITSSGYVGIGTSSPAYPLDVNGRIRGISSIGSLTASNGSGSGQTSIILTREGAATDQKLWEILQDGSGNFGIRAINDGYSAAQYGFNINRGSSYSVDNLQFSTAGSERMRINASGYVGIGTSSPAYPLDVNGNLNVSGNISVAGNQAVNGPAFSAYQSSSQSIASATFTKIQFQTKEFDTNSCFDATTNYRFTPTVAGYYQISGGVNFTSVVNTNSLLTILKNGSECKRFSQPTSGLLGINGSALIYFNGTTDYVELYVYQQSGVSASINPSLIVTYFQGAMIRGA